MRSRLYTIPARIARPFFPGFLWRMPPTGPILYLTFDDGPTAEGTGSLLDLLDQYGAKASFFLVGARAEQHPDLVVRISEAGHTIGNHSYRHADPWTSTRHRLEEDFNRADRVLCDLVQRPIRLVRPPYGRIRPALAGWSRRKGYRIVMWDVVSGDFDPVVTAHGAAETVRRMARPGSIVVLHDNPESRATMLGALERILAHFSQSGWRFEALADV